MKRLRRAASVYSERGVAGLAAAVGRKFRSAEVPQVQWTEFMNWLTYVNAGWLDRGNVDAFDYALQHLPSDAPIIEIGAFCGLSANMLTELKRQHGIKNRLISCDFWGYSSATPGPKPITDDDYRRFQKESYIRNVRTFSYDDLPFAVHATSDHFFEQWAARARVHEILGRDIQLGGRISFAYIDGDHEYEGVKRDFVNVDRWLDRGGCVLFDDSSDDSPWGANRVVKEVLAGGRYRLIARNPHYFFEKEADTFTSPKHSL
jgi:Methyltransferase domain